MAKYIFIDVDGTLLSAGRETPISVLEAFRRAQRNGHKVFLCTGRSKAQVGTYITDMGFDGYIYSSGAVIEVGSDSLHSKQVEPSEIKEFISDLNRLHVGCILEGYNHSFLDTIGFDYLGGVYQNGYAYNKRASYLMEDKTLHIDFYREDSIINKVSFFADSIEQIAEMKAIYGQRFDFVIHETSRHGKTSVEMAIPGHSKSFGIDVILNHFGGILRDTMAIGDSRNDMGMIEHAEIGVCMGNGIPALKEIADYVTESIQGDGIYKAFEKYKLL